MKLNTQLDAIDAPVTHEGARAARISPEQQLRRLTLASMLWEDTFYVDGVSHADAVKAAAAKVSPGTLALLAIECREAQNLRHMPLLLVRELARRKDLAGVIGAAGLIGATLSRVIQRPDELAEFLMIYDPAYGRSKPGVKREPLSAQVKKGLAAAFAKFKPYQLAKYNRDGQVRLKDVMFLCHAKPADGVKGYNRAARKAGKPFPEGKGSEVFLGLTKDALASPDTWEVNLSEGRDKKETFTRLMGEKKLGALALLRNLRNMHESGVDEKIVAEKLLDADYSRVLPFRFIAAARAVPAWEHMIELAFFKAMGNIGKLPGYTGVLVDVSGSMDSALSAKSDMTRMDAGCAVAMILREMCAEIGILAFSDHGAVIPLRRGFALRDAIVNSLTHGGTYTAAAIEVANKAGYDRLVLITDEQSHTAYPDPLKGTKPYLLNVGTYQNGIGYGKWTHIDGWSDACLKYIAAVEADGER